MFWSRTRRRERERDAIISEQALMLAELVARQLDHAAGAGAPSSAPSNTASVCLGAFVFGLARGRWGALERGGVPLDLAVGLLLDLGSGGRHRGQQELQGLAQGALATYCATWGATVGSRLKRGMPAFQVKSSGGAATEHKQRAGGGGAPNGAGSEPSSDQRLAQFIRSVVAS